ncbi:MAG: hypothetical protein GY848_02660 [Methyloversatilis sp.]|jgi:hypothetical protein|uniref:Uncharacterized protein n=1 Tax=Methyloversatilis universalis (strain ATCC BAA-1314 / DSM 25237 / JCM 13912 / CCUG 52030 / FAM5) TaxID=1000565 RepID=F5RB96_METUF|nr:hypothetical protein [Methyloversatilis universalis]EGK72232.1 hypothetical protein METUNv1_01536 [Methyloversatilis universalis FAM5]MCP4635360.1 hypothetical protein [Methyloversatilis sp.]
MKIAAVLLMALASAGALAGEGAVIEATTAAGEKVELMPDGRWRFVDQAKQAEAKKVADTWPQNQGRPEGAQGGWFGTRTLLPGDKDYNRGTLNPKMR